MAEVPAEKTSVSVKVPILPPVSEQDRWSFACKTLTLSTFEGFIRDFPKSERISEAREWIDRVSYADARVKNTVEEYKDYLRRNPSGMFVSLAKEKIGELEREKK